MATLWCGESFVALRKGWATTQVPDMIIQITSRFDNPCHALVTASEAPASHSLVLCT